MIDSRLEEANHLPFSFFFIDSVLCFSTFQPLTSLRTALLLHHGPLFVGVWRSFGIVNDEDIANCRNVLAYGDRVTREVAEDLRTKIIGIRGQPGLLSWLALHLDPPDAQSNPRREQAEF